MSCGKENGTIGTNERRAHILYSLPASLIGTNEPITITAY